MNIKVEFSHGWSRKYDDSVSLIDLYTACKYRESLKEYLQAIYGYEVEVSDTCQDGFRIECDSDIKDAVYEYVMTHWHNEDWL